MKFLTIIKKKKQVDKNWRECILLRIDVYFTEYLLAIETDEKNILAEILFLRRKDKKHQKKNFLVNLLELTRVSDTMKIMKSVEYKHLLVNLRTDI